MVKQILPPGVLSSMLVALILTGCASQFVPGVYRARDDYKAYTRALNALELNETELGRAWIATGNRALESPIEISSSAFEMGYFNPSSPDAVGFAFSAREGKTIAITVTVDDEETTTLFADLFRREENGELQHVASAGEESSELLFETRRPGEYLLRIQPELLRGGRYFLTIKTDAALGFPIEGGTPDAIWSFFGDPRDGGTRDHHGVDIFAPRGTPILAPASGEVVHVRWNELGGNIVGVWDAKRRIYYYFAHMEKQLARVGEMVEVGDTLGLVGNSGNAEATPPHLHFGMYVDMREPIDPYHFITRVAGTLGPIEADDAPIGLWNRTVADETPLFAGPEGEVEIARLPGHMPLLVTGVQRNRYRVLLPDGSSGYLPPEAIESTSQPLEIGTANGGPVRTAPEPEGDIITELPTGTELPLLAFTDSYALVRFQGTPLWVSLASLELQ